MLRLAGNGIEDAGARTIAAALHDASGGGNDTLRALVLDDNRITADGARGLADALARGAPLTALALRSNLLGADGARHLAVALRTSTSLEVAAPSDAPLRTSFSGISSALSHTVVLRVGARTSALRQYHPQL